MRERQRERERDLQMVEGCCMHVLFWWDKRVMKGRSKVTPSSIAQLYCCSLHANCVCVYVIHFHFYPLPPPSLSPSFLFSLSCAVVFLSSLSGSTFVTFVCSRTTATDSAMAFGGHGTCSVSAKNMKHTTLFHNLWFLLTTGH